jgi:hypothetical protein
MPAASVAVLAASAGPTGLSTTLGQIAIAAALVLAIVTGIRALWQWHKRR